VAEGWKTDAVLHLGLALIAGTLWIDVDDTEDR